MTKQFPPCFASDFDKKLTQSVARDYVISRVKILSSPALCA